MALTVEADAAAQSESGGHSGSLRAAMPGTVAAMHVAEGEAVIAGQVLVVIESMKLFMELKSPADGRVGRIATWTGATVAAGELLLQLETGAATST